MEVIMRSIILSMIMGISCKAFFDAVIPEYRWKRRWPEYTIVLAFFAGFFLIAVSEIPPYLFQPVRVILVIAVIVQIYFRIKPVQNIILSTVFCGVYWIVSILTASIFAVLPTSWSGGLFNPAETVSSIVYLALMLFFHYRFKKHVQGFQNTGWTRFGYIPVFSLAVIMAISILPWDETIFGESARLTAVVGFAILNIGIVYMIGSVLAKETQMQRLKLLHERTQDQMHMYQSMQKNYEQQRRYMHDYKNQLNCIQGMILEGRTEETLEYISKLTGSLRKNADFVNTNHTVVNVVLNQKYQDALEKGITMTMAVNDLSSLTMSEEEIVTLLVNLLDNAIEACGKLEQDRIIQFKMILENKELILSIRNPVKEPVRIRNNTIVTSKPDAAAHGIGLLNVDAVIRKNNGTSILRCEDGYFYFSAMLPDVSTP